MRFASVPVFFIRMRGFSYRDVPFIRSRDTENALDRCAFPGTVSPKQCKYGSFFASKESSCTAVFFLYFFVSLSTRIIAYSSQFLSYSNMSPG